MRLDPSRLSANSGLGRLVRLPLALLPKQWAIPIQSGKLRGARWIVGAMNHGCWLGTYERANQDLFTKLLRDGDVFLDLGANVGFFTLLAARAVGEAGLVFAVEPSPRNLAYLERHLAINGINNVHIVSAAVSDRPGWVRFAKGDTVSAGHIGELGDVLVWADRVDAIWKHLGHLPAMIKIDVEGAEGAVLRGMEELLRSHQPLVHLSSHGDDSYRECSGLMDPLGYRRLDSRDVIASPRFGVLRESLFVPDQRYDEIRAIATEWIG